MIGRERLARAALLVGAIVSGWRAGLIAEQPIWLGVSVICFTGLFVIDKGWRR